MGLAIALLFASGKLLAAPVELSKAQEMAEEFYRVQQFVATKNLPDFACVYPDQALKGGNAPFYIFNVGDNQGFVIVSGDDNTRNLILAYSDRGRFETENMPANVRSWLALYEEEVELAAQSATSTVLPKGFSKVDTVVSPLLGQISYNQDAPYNAMCPKDPNTGVSTYTGCVATALASIAKYYEFPAQGKGTVDYTTNSLRLHITGDLSQSQYDWDNILESYGRGVDYTQEQADAVALLMRDLGYAVHMDYGTESSGATTDPIIKGMVEHMGFDSLVSVRSRSDYATQEDWEAMLKYNLDNSQPLYYQGQSKGGGHAFLCDGYTDAGYFHINWGWGGSSDGYFLVSVMNPDNRGIGAGSGGGYSSYQSVFQNMVPQGMASEDGYFLFSNSQIRSNDLEEDTMYVASRPFSVSVNSIRNYTMAAFDGNIALGLFQDTGFVAIVSDEAAFQVEKYASASLGRDLQANLSDIEDGDYELWLVCRSNLEGSVWNKMNSSCSGTSDVCYIPLTVQDGMYGLRAVAATLTIEMDCPIDNRRIALDIYRNGHLYDNVNVNPDGGELELLYGTYDLHFSTREFDTTHVLGLKLQRDTTIVVKMNQIILDPYIRVCRVNGNTMTMMWYECDPRLGTSVSPENYVVYLDEAVVDTVDSDVLQYVFEGLPLGEHQAGLQSLYAGGVSNIVIDSFEIREVANEPVQASLFRISPNPSVNGQYRLSSDVPAQLAVCNASGKILVRREIAAGLNELDLSALEDGLYFFRITAGEKVEILKVVKL